MKNSKMKVASLSLIASLSAITANASEGKTTLTNTVASVNVTKNQKPNVYSIWELYDLEVSKTQRERSIIANEIRSDFGGYVSKHFDIPLREKECLDTTWKQNPELISIVEGFASAIESGQQLGVLIVNGEKLSTVNESLKEQDVINSTKDEVNSFDDKNFPKYSTLTFRGGKGKVGTKREVGTGKLYIYAELTFDLW